MTLEIYDMYFLVRYVGLAIQLKEVNCKSMMGGLKEHTTYAYRSEHRLSIFYHKSNVRKARNLKIVQRTCVY